MVGMPWVLHSAGSGFRASVDPYATGAQLIQQTRLVVGHQERAHGSVVAGASLGNERHDLLRL